ncbi:MAG TPA: hypothetical protein VF681_07480 [Abditibacteriaceae bacterium]|jgi:hypothetical protein
MKSLLHRPRFYIQAAVIVLPFLFALLLSGCGRKAPAGPIFDISALVGSKFEGVVKVLGEAETAAVESAGAETKRAQFKKNDAVLAVEYLQRNGRVVSFTLSPNASVKDEEKAQLLKLGNLKESDPRYRIEYVEDANQVFRFAGVRVIPAPVRHEVVLRIVGTGMVAARYTAPNGENGTVPGETFYTIPPWDIKFTAETGTVVGIEAGPATALRNGVPTGKSEAEVQILVDGKIVQQKKSIGVAEVEAELD